jgi:hypothetical protein
MHGEKRLAYKFSVRKSEGKRLLRKYRRRWEDCIKMDFKEIYYGSMDWINVA